MRTRLPVVIAVAVCLSSLIPVGGVGAVSEGSVVAVSVDEPSVWVGESVEATVTVDNSRYTTLDVESVGIVDENGTVRAERRPDPGWVDPGESRQWSFDLSIDDIGVSELTAVVQLEDSEEAIRKSVTVVAREPTPLVDLGTGMGSVSNERIVRLKLANPHDEPISRIETTLSGPESIELTDESGIIPTIQPGETRELAFDVQGVDAGRASFDITLSFGTADGKFWVRNVTETVIFNDSTDRMPPSAAPVRLAGLEVSGSGELVISGDVANTRSTTLTGVLISFPDEINSTDKRFVGSVSGGEFAPFNPISASIPSDRTTIPIEISYTVENTRYTTVFELPVEGVSDDAAVPEPNPDGSAVPTDSGRSDEDQLPIPIAGIGAAAVLLVVLVGSVVYRRR